MNEWQKQIFKKICQLVGIRPHRFYQFRKCKPAPLGAGQVKLVWTPVKGDGKATRFVKVGHTLHPIGLAANDAFLSRNWAVFKQLAQFCDENGLAHYNLTGGFDPSPCKGKRATVILPTRMPGFTCPALHAQL